MASIIRVKRSTGVAAPSPLNFGEVGLTVGVGQSVSYYDQWINQQVTVNPVSQPVTNYEYEDRLNAQKRGIFVLKGLYLNIVFDDIEKMMGYKKGSTNFISRTLKRADNIRLYD